MKASTEKLLDSRLTFFLSKKHKALLDALACEETIRTKEKVTVSTLVRQAVQELLEPSEQYIVCCNDYPDSVCNTKKVALQVVEHRKIEFEKMEGRKRYWHIRKCPTFHKKPTPLKFCDFSPPDKASRDCPDAVITGEEDWIWCDKQKIYNKHFLCTNKKRNSKVKKNG